MFTLRFDPGDLAFWAARYDVSSDAEVELEIAPAVKARGYFTRPEFLAIARWKTPRSAPRCEENDAEFVEETTNIALAANSERLRIGVLMLLHGVGWPTASVILHFAHVDPYPILDFRALWSLNTPVPNSYNFDFWWAYTQACRELTAQQDISMRTLDRALWQYSIENRTE